MLNPPGGDKVLRFDAKALTGIYFGASMTEPMMHKIATMPANSAPRLYRMKRSETEFKLEYEPYHP